MIRMLISDGGYAAGLGVEANLPAKVEVVEVRHSPDPSHTLYWVKGDDLDRVFGHPGLFSGENWPFYNSEFSEVKL